MGRPNAAESAEKHAKRMRGAAAASDGSAYCCAAARVRNRRTCRGAGPCLGVGRIFPRDLSHEQCMVQFYRTVLTQAQGTSDIIACEFFGDGRRERQLLAKRK